MARLLRIEFPGALHHAMSSGSMVFLSNHEFGSQNPMRL